jgi:hypothetical protein
MVRRSMGDPGRSNRRRRRAGDVFPFLRSRSIMRHFRNFMQHFFNPLHVYCRLKDMGVTTPTAHRVSRAYERYLWRFMW